MSFKEKSAWLMSCALLVATVFYFARVISASQGVDQLPPPHIPSLFAYTLLLAVIAIVGHIFIASFSAKDANAKVDEREQKIFERAGYWSSQLLGGGVIVSLLLYLFFNNGDLLFYTVLGSLILAQLINYAVQIYSYRTGLV